MIHPPKTAGVRLAVAFMVAALFAQPATAQCPVWVAEASIPQFNDGFGSSIAHSGGTWVTGVPGHFGAGEALVYEASIAGAIPAGVLWPTDLAVLDGFGTSVAIEGDMIAVGSPGDDDGAFGAGSVYIFERFFGSWIQTGKLQAAFPATAASFGYSVALGQDWLAVGAPFDSTAAPVGGRVSLFQRTSAGWILRQEEVGTDFDRLGTSLDIDDGQLAIGVPGVGLGRVEMFDLGQTIALPAQVLEPFGASDGAEFGSAVDLFGGRALVGARSDSVEAEAAGAAFLFGRVGPTWKQAQKLTAEQPASHDRFGASVDMADEVLLIGAPGEDTAAANGGAAHMYSRVDYGSASVWVELSLITPLGAQSGSNFGSAVTLGQFGLWIGAPAEDTTAVDSGRAHAYSLFELGCSSLSVGPKEVSASNPTKLEFEVNAGPQFAGMPYFLIGSSAAFTAPTLIGGHALPLTLPNDYGALLIGGTKNPAIVNTLNFLDQEGRSTASIDLATLGYPLVNGSTLSHAYFIFGEGKVQFVSSAALVQVLF